MKCLKDILDYSFISSIEGPTNLNIRKIAYNSGNVETESIFFAIKGTKINGEQFIPDAIKNGAHVIVVEEYSSYRNDNVTVIYATNIRKLMAKMAKLFYNRVDSQLKLVGITGTNGKTTISFILYHLFQYNHLEPALIGTVEYRIGDEILPATHTTPESVDIYELMVQAFSQGCKSMIMEVSSHALAMERVYGLEFDAGVFTNLTREHLDYHHTMDNYFEAKAKLFLKKPEYFRAIINLDDPYGQKLADSIEGELFTYGFHPDAAVRPLRVDYKLEGTFVEMSTPLGKMHVMSSYIGKFNVSNILAAVATGVAMGFTYENITQAIQNLPQVPGRCEKYLLPQKAVAVIDYAHSPDALKNICEALRELTGNKLIIVFGAGGDRDKGKRSEMGKVAEDYCDYMILTNDNPRTENPQIIIEHILEGISGKENYTVEYDRAKAIEIALEMAEKNDVVLIAGKGHEQYQEINGIRHFFDDREIVKKWIEKKINQGVNR